jgi:hypothetical protein
MYFCDVYSFCPTRPMFHHFVTVMTSREERHSGKSALYFIHHLSSNSLLSALSLDTSNYVILDRKGIAFHSLYSLAWYGTKLSYSEFSHVANMKIPNCFMCTITVIVCKIYRCVTCLTSLTTRFMKDGDFWTFECQLLWVTHLVYDRLYIYTHTHTHTHTVHGCYTTDLYRHGLELNCLIKCVLRIKFMHNMSECFSCVISQHFCSHILECMNIH